jgi:hypothetical protein
VEERAINIMSAMKMNIFVAGKDHPAYRAAFWSQRWGSHVYRADSKDA